MKKVMIIGCPGGGKSTFARGLHDAVKIPLFHLDMLYWNADKTIVSKPIFRQRLRSVIEQDSWIIDGNYGSTIELRLQACDTVFFLDYSTEVCLDGVRSRKGKVRSDMPWTEAEDEEDEEFLIFIKTYNSVSRSKIMELFNKYSDKNIIIFKNISEANAFLNHLKFH